MHLCKPLFQECRHSSGVFPPLQGQQSVTAAQLQSHLKAETTWLRLTLADSCLTGTQMSFLISSVRLQLPPALPSPFLYITTFNKSLRSLSLVRSEENRPSSVSGGLMEKWKMRSCAHNLCQVVYFFTQPAAISFSSPPHLQQHAQPENALIPCCPCQYKHRTCCFQAFPTSSCPTGLQTRPLATTLFPTGPGLVHTMTTHLTQTFQNPVSLFISLSDKVKQRVSGPMPPAVLGCKGHLRLFLFVSVWNINTRDQTTARHGQPQRSHAPIILTLWGVLCLLKLY